MSRTYLVSEKPDAIINIVDGTNIERNLYLSTQLLELGIPTVIAVNMIDIVRKNGDTIDLVKLGKALGCEAVETSALKGEGSKQVALRAAELAREKKYRPTPSVFEGSVEHAIAHIEESLEGMVAENLLRWYSIKVFERDEKAITELGLKKEVLSHIEKHIRDCEYELDDDAESIIVNQRYAYISKLIERTVLRKHAGRRESPSDRIDRVVTNRVLALPIFAAMMILVYYISISTVGGMLTDWTKDVLFGEIISGNLAVWLEGMSVAPWLSGLVVEGVVGGVGAVLSFVPQMLVLFLMLSLLEEVGYMARVAFIMDRLFRRFGLSGKSFISMLIGSGCTVPGIMASRTIESDRDRRMTIMTTSFIPCGAKMPIIGLFAGAFFGGSWLIAALAYFIGVASVVVSGIILKKTKPFAGDVAPFVMELPAYHAPMASSILRTTWERGWSFIKRAGTVILLASVLLWFLQAFGFEGSGFGMVEDNDHSLLATVGRMIAPIFAPLGFGNWKAAVATLSGLVAKESVVSTFGVLYGFAEISETGAEYWASLAADYTKLTAFSFLLFNLLCAPCFAAMGAIKREMNSTKWTWAAIGYLCGFAYAVCIMLYQFGLLFAGNGFTLGTAAAVLVLAGVLYMLFRKNKYLASKPAGKEEARV